MGNILIVKKFNDLFKMWIQVIGSLGGTITLSGGGLTQQCTLENTDTYSFLVEEKTDYILTTDYKCSNNGISITANERNKTYNVSLPKAAPTISVAVSSMTIQGGAGSGTLTVTYKGIDNDSSKLSDLIVTSSNTEVCTATLTLNNTTEDGTRTYTAAITYITAGNSTLTFSTEENNYYSAVIEQTVTVTCARTSLTIPSLSGTSFSTTGSNVGPTVSNYNSTYMTQSGTTSTATIGSYTVTWALKDSSRYCWSDGATANKSATWKCVAGTITFYVKFTYVYNHDYTGTFAFNVSYSNTGSTFAELIGSSGLISSSGSFTSYYSNAFTYSAKAMVFAGATYVSAKRQHTKKTYSSGKVITSESYYESHKLYSKGNNNTIVKSTDNIINGHTYYWYYDADN